MSKAAESKLKCRVRTRTDTKNDHIFTGLLHLRITRWDDTRLILKI